VSGREIVVAGAGHNGLVAAAYLARAGHDVLVVERRQRPGGILDGVVDNVGRLHPQVAADLELERRGLQLEWPAARMAALRDDGPPVVFWADAERTAAGLEEVSAADAAAYPGFDRHVRALAGVVSAIADTTPPRLDRPTTGDAAAALRLGRAYRGLGEHESRELTRALPMAAADLVGEWFESDAVRGPIAARGSFFTAMGPWSAGTAAVILADSASDGAGAAGATAFARGGARALADALAASAEAAGVEVRTGVEVERVLTDGEAVTGVALGSGEHVQAAVVVSAVDPKTVLTRWLDPVVVGPQLRWRAGNIRTPGAAARVELELSEPPAFTGLDGEAAAGRLVVARGIDEVERAFDAWKYGRISERPLLEAVISGNRVNVIAQWVPYREGLADEVGDRVVGELDRHAPGLAGLVSSRRVLTPFELEREYGLPGGHIHHAEPGLDQFFAWRPVVGLARYRLGLRGLYLCGPGAHPGGGVTGRPGRNAAREILRDLAG
jgi:phytoene dehydrogenase-like protein